MERKRFLQTLALLPLSAAAMKLNSLYSISQRFEPTERMPVLFLGHGTPMNAIADNIFTRGFQSIAKTLPKPNAILCISAHWETKGTYVTAMEKPKTIHDFGGFPQALFDVQYPAPGSSIIANEIKSTIKSIDVGLDTDWGLDHGTWSVVKFLYPNADVPVIQMSIDYTQPASYHYALAKQLASLRRKGVLIIGSGNSVHNLGTAAWDKMSTPGYAYEWATIANEKIKDFILKGDHNSLINFDKQGKEMLLGIPSPEHYLPMIYALALQEKDEQPVFYNDSIVAGSLNMLSVKIDKR
ncbi:4,5-DOPA dioxygenase extradiol [Flavobacterium sp. LM4]|uniref:4,5-DOPA-extradiol-dioxygenase n=1 Tax=Flavobacterium sp. LM4 TaxID=1938609 RepID=UPI0009925106|nr:4,5-DOPA dioxygenase extradiol [Flavobacterium sp. LM4]